ncbi:MAG: succinate--CoA ligase subunit alpha, partial [Alphaproteobacteria bacterium]|nr:succinate--CoA ligase subunit alpha [Alphaproteobacteria bacterium]
MSVFVNKNTKVICQGITGTQASFHIQRSLDYGTKIVGGITPGKGGSMHLNLPVFDKVKEAVQETQATASVMYVPAPAVKNAAREAIEAELDLVVSITDRVPLKDMLEIKAMLKGTKTKFIGPNTPGII